MLKVAFHKRIHAGLGGITWVNKSDSDSIPSPFLFHSGLESMEVGRAVE